MHFTSETSCIIYGNHLDVVQRMLDYDFVCGRTPSVKAILVPETSQHHAKVFFGTQEIFIPYCTDWLTVRQYAPCDVLINFASVRSAPDVVKRAIDTGVFKAVFTIAEGIPERTTRELIAYAAGKDCMLFGPSIVWWIIAGVLRIGNTWWSLENITLSKLWKPWSVGIVSKSWGMMNELCRVVSKQTDGVHTALQVGGDRYAMTTFSEVIHRYQSVPEIKMIVMLGEVGNEEEIIIADMIERGELTKPLVARVAWTSAWALGKNVQFWHAWAQANSDRETAAFKNAYLLQKWAYVPESYAAFGDLIGQVYRTQIHGDVSWWQTASRDKGTSILPDEVPQEIQQKLNLLRTRRWTSFTSTISDERGEELMYNKIPVSDFVEKWSLTRVIGHLWFKQELPDYALRFLEVCLILLADHGPAVSGATNTIITARAGKDLVDSVAAGLLTIGPRFGGAITAAGQYFLEGVQSGMEPAAFMNHKRAQSGPIISGIGHKVKSIYNPDKRCSLLLEHAATFSSKTYLSFAQAIEQLTTQKKPNLILNVDGMIAALLLDMLTDLGYTQDSLKETIDSGLFNGFFVLARTIGLIGHYADQKRLGEWLYRTSWEDILYT